MAGAAGQIRFNNSTIGSSTQISIALEDADGATHSNLFSKNSQFIIYGTTAGDIITVASYTVNTVDGTRALLDVSSSDVEQNGTFSNSEDVLVQYVKNGANGSAGAKGEPGAQGQKGAAATISNDGDGAFATLGGNGGITGSSDIKWNDTTDELKYTYSTSTIRII